MRLGARFVATGTRHRSCELRREKKIQVADIETWALIWALFLSDRPAHSEIHAFIHGFTRGVPRDST